MPAYDKITNLATKPLSGIDGVSLCIQRVDHADGRVSFGVHKCRPCPSWLGGGGAWIVAPAMVEYSTESGARYFYDGIK